MSDGNNYFEFHDEESECPTEISKKQFWHLPLSVNVPLRVRVWPWQLQDQPEH